MSTPVPTPSTTTNRATTAPQPSTGTRTDTFRRRAAAASLAGAAVLFAVEIPLYPGDDGDAARQLGTYAAHHGTLLTAIAAGLVSSILFVPALFALVRPVRGRGTVLTHLGGGLALLGTMLSGLVIVGLEFVAYEASAPGADRPALARFLAHAQQDPVGMPIVLGHVLFSLGLVVLAVGLWRAGAGPRWAVLCFGAAPLVDAVLGTAGLEGTHAAVVASSTLTDVLLVVGALGLARWLATAPRGPEVTAVPAPRSATP